MLKEMAASYEQPEEFIRWYNSQPQQLANVEGLVLENNVVEWVLSKAKVTDKTVALDDLMQAPGQAA